MDDTERRLFDLLEENKDSSLTQLLKIAYKCGREEGIRDMEEGFSNMVALVLSYSQQSDDALVN